MHPIFLQLETDHQRMQRMLYDLNHQIESYFGLHDAPADIDAMMRCLDYIQIYPEVWHHPVEDIIFRQLLTKPGVNQYAVENVLRDHGMLEALSDQLSLIFSELRLSEKPVRPAIIRLSKHYHSRQISHIHEERGIFQMAGELFGDADWQAIECEIDAVIGPVGQHERDDYLSTFKPESASYSGAFKQLVVKGLYMPTAIAREFDNATAIATDMVRRYAVQGPRYTSYPTALNFSEAFTDRDYVRFLDDARNSPSPLSLYVHIPFCRSLCYYCACNKVITKDPRASRRYLDHLNRELQLLSRHVGVSRRVSQLHLGGGTPNYLDKAEMTELVHQLASHFNLDDSDDREFSIELDPRCVDEDYLALLKGLGFNRVSFGVQDTNPDVQQAINRVQSEDMIAELMSLARRFKFRSVSADLIYGLPLQTEESFKATLDALIAMSPDRIAIYHYAHMPQRFKWQKSMDRYPMPDSEEKLKIFALASQRLQAAGYLHIGMDHFVKPNDELAIYQQQGRLQRNFQGYSTCHSPDVLGMGVSAISSLGRCYAQNEKDLEAYYAEIEAGRLPVARGLELSAEDMLRRYVIMQLACNLKLDFKDLYGRYQVSFREKFAKVLPPLEEFHNSGVLLLSDEGIKITEAGRAVLRNVCMLFDESLSLHRGAYSKTL